jgi:catechol-2,3-dioxygenase
MTRFVKNRQVDSRLRRKVYGKPRRSPVRYDVKEHISMASHGLLHIALLTRDLKTTEKFYTDVLGLKVAFRVPPNMVFLRSRGSKDLLNFIATKKRISPSRSLEHFWF